MLRHEFEDVGRRLCELDIGHVRGQLVAATVEKIVLTDRGAQVDRVTVMVLLALPDVDLVLETWLLLPLLTPISVPRYVLETPNEDDTERLPDAEPMSDAPEVALLMRLPDTYPDIEAISEELGNPIILEADIVAEESEAYTELIIVALIEESDMLELPPMAPSYSTLMFASLSVGKALTSSHV